MFATKNGIIKKTSLEAYSHPRANGVIAINIMEGDQVVGVRLTNGNNELLLANRNGRAIRFNENEVRTMGRVSTGVRGMRLDEGDKAVTFAVIMSEEEVDSTEIPADDEPKDDDTESLIRDLDAEAEALIAEIENDEE